MIYVAINEEKEKGKALLQFLRGIDEHSEYVGFMDDSKELEDAIIDAMNTPRAKSGNSLREIISSNGI
jgi:hypothetical protein